MEELKKLIVPLTVAIGIVLLIAVVILLTQRGSLLPKTTSPQTTSNEEGGVNAIDKALETIGVGKSNSDDSLEPLSTPTGMIAGSVTKYSSAFQNMQVCAKNIITRQISCESVEKVDANTANYKLSLTPGQYSVFAMVGSGDYLGVYNQIANCTPGSTCSSDPLVVEVIADKTLININPDDWDSGVSIP